MKIKMRLRLNTYIALGVFILILLSLGWLFREMSRATHNVDLVAEMRKVAFEKVALRDDYLLYQEERARIQWYAKSGILRGLLESASQIFTGNKDKGLVIDARKDFDATVSLFSQFMDDQKREGRAAKTGFDLTEAESRLIGQVFLKAYALSDSIGRLHESALSKRRTVWNIGLFIIIASVLGGFFLIVINSYYVNTILTRRIAVLGKGVAIVGGGDLDFRIMVEGDDELSALANASNEMAAKLKDSVENLQKEIDNRKRVEELIQVRIGLLEYSTGHTLEELLRKTLDEVGRLVDSPIGFYHFVEPDQKTLSLQAWSTLTLERYCRDAGEGLHYNIDKAGVWVDCVRQRKPVIHNDYASLPHRKGLPEGHAAVIRELVVPVLRDERIVSILGMGNKPREYTEQDVNRVNYLADVAWEIVEHKRADEALYLAHQRLRCFVDSNIVGIVIADPDGQIVEANDYYLRLIGFTREELDSGKVDWRAITPTEWLPADQQAIRELCEGGACAPYEKEYARRDGTRVPVLLAVALLPGPEKQIAAFALDRTEHKAAEAQLKRTLADLERSNRELEQFAYVASHDLQEPLRMVSSYTQLLAQRFEGKLDDKTIKYIDYVVDGAVRMQRLINDLLAYSRVNTQGKTPEMTDSHAVLGEALRDLSVAIEENRAIVINENLPMVRADPTQLSQLFQNLIGNAIKFRGVELPRIQVSAGDLGREWRFSVKDNGIGIDAQYADKVFVIFQRLHTRREYPGTGIGLAICKRIVERHGGRIWFDSEPGNGSTFYFTLPK